MKKIELYKNRAGEFQFRVITENRQILYQSPSFQSRASCIRAIDSYKKSPNLIGEVAAQEIDLKSESSSQKRIGNVKTFLEKLENIHRDLDSVLFFRGHSDHEFKLLPGIYRHTNLIHNEDIIFKELMLRCPSDLPSQESTFQILVKMQHYSLPTRLLDITSNPLIALFFACHDEENKGKNAEVVILRIPKSEVKYFDSDTVSVIANLSRRPSVFEVPDEPNLKKFNESMHIKGLIHEIRREKSYFEPSIQRDHLQSVICVKPKLDNARIARQEGGFLLFGISGNKINPAIVPTRYIEKSEPLIIRYQDKERILEQLAALGITEATIYPEIDKVASNIKSNYLNHV